MKWIDINEERPALRQLVLTKNDELGIFEIGYPVLKDNYWWMESDSGNLFCMGVTHWIDVTELDKLLSNEQPNLS